MFYRRGVEEKSGHAPAANFDGRASLYDFWDVNFDNNISHGKVDFAGLRPHSLCTFPGTFQHTGEAAKSPRRMLGDPRGIIEKALP